MTPSKSDRIAICGELIPQSLKHRLLFFDRIGVFSIEKVVEMVHLFEMEEFKDLANDLEFLQSKDCVFDTVAIARGPLRRSEQLPPEQEADLLSAELIGRQIEEISKGWDRLPKAQLLGVSLLKAQVQFLARMSARRMRHSEGLEVSAVLSEPLFVPNKMKHVYDEFQRPSTDIIDIVLDKLPMPSEQTPWEAILDFKADTEAQGYLQGLKVWMNEVARQNLTPTEAKEKLEWLIFQHKKHLEMHKLSYRWGTLGGTFVATATILEDLVKIKWGKTAEAIVSIGNRKLELMKAELSNPAKEISYIVKAQEQFGE
jgi:hypothetical protein